MIWLLIAVPLSLTPFCDGFRLAPGSPAIDAGAWIQGIHCPAPGFDDSGCVEWFGTAPDIGACEFIPGTPPAPPSNLQVNPSGGLLVLNPNSRLDRFGHLTAAVFANVAPPF